MKKNAYKIIAIVSLIAALIGLISFIAGTRNVNIGSFVFPLLISGVSFWLYRK